MKIQLESGERLLVEVPQVASSACVAIQTTPGPKIGSRSHQLVDVVIEDGLIGYIEEHVTRRQPSPPAEDRLTLWAHLISEHGSLIGFDMSLAELIAAHEHEHAGPGTIRNHPRESREARLPKVITVLSESDHYGLPKMTGAELRAHVKCVNREIEFRLKAGDDDYEGSWREAADNEGARIAAESRKED